MHKDLKWQFKNNFSFLSLMICFTTLVLSGCLPVPAPLLVPPEETEIPPTISSKILYPPIPSGTPRPTSSNTIPTLMLTMTKFLEEPTQTATSIQTGNTPTATPQPGTLAYLQTFPKFDINLLITATQSAAQICPETTQWPEKIPASFDPYTKGGTTNEEFLSFLNTYGVEPLVGKNAIPGRMSYPNPNILAFQDFTNDGVPEIIVSRHYFEMYSCRNGKHNLIFSLEKDSYGILPKIIKILDLNRNGIPEIYLRTSNSTQGGKEYNGIEWDGTRFKWLLRLPGQPEDDIFGVQVAPGYMTFEDMDKDAIKEVVIVSEIPIGSDYFYGLPWRNAKLVYKWDGKVFMFYREILDPPIFRFQAVQDGDRAVLLGEYDRALDLYQQVIYSDELEWFSEGRRWTMKENFNEELQNQPTSTLPAPDPDEYGNLAAYSFYRIMLLHIVRGYNSDARVIYNLLRSRYTEDQPGYVYAEMATTFWEEYETSKSLQSSCKKAYGYGIRHLKEITPYLGPKFHGWQSINYQDNPNMLCPFQ